MSRQLVKEIGKMVENLPEEKLVSVFNYLKKLGVDSLDNDDIMKKAEQIMDEEDELLRRLAE